MSINYVGIATVLAAATSLVTALAGAYARVKFGPRGGGDDDLDALQAQIDELRRRRNESTDTGTAEFTATPGWCTP